MLSRDPIEHQPPEPPCGICNTDCGPDCERCGGPSCACQCGPADALSPHWRAWLLSLPVRVRRERVLA